VKISATPIVLLIGALWMTDEQWEEFTTTVARLNERMGQADDGCRW